jgi:hypothetical protein
MICRYCRSRDGEAVLDLGHQPLCDDFPRGGDGGADPTYPLQMWFCRACELSQLVDDTALLEETPGLAPQAMRDLAVRNLDRLDAAGLLPPGAAVTEFPSPHGDSWEPWFADYGLAPVPRGTRRQVDVVLDAYGLLHETDQRAALAQRVAVLAEQGTLALQLHSLAAVVTHGQWGELRHGHYAYWSAPGLARALADVGLGVHRAWLDPMEEGTLLVAARRHAEPDRATEELLAAERAAGSCSPARLRGLQERADESAGALREWLENQQRAGRRVAGAAAASRAVPVLCHAGVDASLLAMVSDGSPAKQGARMPGTDVPIVSPEQLRASAPDLVVVFVPYLLDELRAALPGIEEAGGRWVVLDPEPRIAECQPVNNPT